MTPWTSNASSGLDASSVKSMLDFSASSSGARGSVRAMARARMFEIYAYGNVDTLTGSSTPSPPSWAGPGPTGGVRPHQDGIAHASSRQVDRVIVAANFAGPVTPGKPRRGWLMGFLRRLTRFFETCPSRPGHPSTNAAAPTVAATYQKNGVMFGNRLIQASRAANVADPQLRPTAFVHRCIRPAGRHDRPAFARQHRHLVADGARPTSAALPPTRQPGAGRHLPERLHLPRCPPAAGRSGARAIDPAFQLNPRWSRPAALTAIDAQIEQAYYKTKIATAAQGAADLLRQNIMINLVQDSRSLAGQKLNDPAALMIATARANATGVGEPCSSPWARSPSRRCRW